MGGRYGGMLGVMLGDQGRSGGYRVARVAKVG